MQAGPTIIEAKLLYRWPASEVVEGLHHREGFRLGMGVPTSASPPRSLIRGNRAKSLYGEVPPPIRVVVGRQHAIKNGITCILRRDRKARRTSGPATKTGINELLAPTMILSRTWPRRTTRGSGCGLAWLGAGCRHLETVHPSCLADGALVAWLQPR